MEGFPKRRDRHRPLAQLRMGQHAGVSLRRKADMLVNLIADHVNLTLGNRLPQRGEILALPDRRRRVMRGIEDHQPGTLAQRSGKLLPVNAKMRRLQGNALQHAAGKLNRRGIAVVARVKADNLIPGAHQGGNGRIQGLGGARRHGHIAVGIRSVAVKLGGFIGDSFTQRRHAGHRGVLVGTLGDMKSQPLLKVARPVKIREAL